jgi:hypothetical protein
MAEKTENERKENTKLTSVRWGWIHFLELKGFEPKALVTLTFKEVDTSPQRAWNLLKKWVHEVNKFVEGPKYKRRWKHSYFSYFVVAEYQTRGAIHYHLLIDRWFPWDYASRYWWNIAGFIDIRKVDNTEAAIRYVTKYLTKGGDEPVIWFANRMWDKKKRINLQKLVDRYLDEKVPDIAGVKHGSD